MTGISHFRVLGHFPGFREAVRQAGFDPHPQGQRIASAELLRDWAAVARKVRCLPSRSQYVRHGRYSAGVFTLRFGSWTAVGESFARFVEANGLEEELGDVVEMIEIAGIAGIARNRRNRETLATGDIDGKERFPAGSIAKGSIHLESRGRRGDATSLRPAFSIGGERKEACVPLPPPLARAPVPHELGTGEIAEERTAPTRRAQAGVPVPHENRAAERILERTALTRVAQARAPVPQIPSELAGQRCVTQNILALIVNTLAPQGALEDSETASAEEGTVGIPRKNLTADDTDCTDEAPTEFRAAYEFSVARRFRSFYRDRTVLGSPLQLAGLAYEPVNEAGVVFLFGMLAHHLGFRVEALRAGFPDCEAVREIQPGRWQRVRIEFEFESRNFLTHRHPAQECDVIVCWRHNWPDCPVEVDVVELRKAVASKW